MDVITHASCASRDFLSLASRDDAALRLVDATLVRSDLSSSSLRHVRKRRHSGWRREGIVVARAWDAGFDEQEYRLLLVGGSQRRLHTPDAYTRDGQPVYRLSAIERRQSTRLLDRLCHEGFEQRAILRRHNVACNDGRNSLLNTIANVSGYTGVQWFAVGTGTNPNGPQSGDHQLFSEFFRKQPTSYTVSGNQTLIATFFQATEGVTTYTEAGLFGSAPTGYTGASASGGFVANATPNTGILFAHVNYPYTKSGSVTLTNDYYVYEQ